MKKNILCFIVLLFISYANKCAQIEKSISRIGNTKKELLTWLVHSGRSYFIKEWYWDSSSIESIALNHDGSKIVTGHKDGVVNVWDIANNEVILSMTGHTTIDSVSFSNDGTMIASSSIDDDKLIIWDAQTGELRREFEGSNCKIEFHKSDQFIITYSPFWMQVRVWGIDTGSLEKSLHGHFAKFNAAGNRFFVDNGFVFAMREFSKYLLEDSECWYIGKPSFFVEKNKIYACEDDIIAIGDGNTIQLWKGIPSKLYKTIECCNGEIPLKIMSITFNQDGNKIAVTCKEPRAIYKNIKVFDVESGNLLYTIARPNCYHAFFVPSHNLIGYRFDSNIQLIEAETGNIIITLYILYDTRTISKDGNTLAFSSKYKLGICDIGKILKIKKILDTLDQKQLAILENFCRYDDKYSGFELSDEVISALPEEIIAILNIIIVEDWLKIW